jgi:hypothetical protein
MPTNQPPPWVGQAHGRGRRSATQPESHDLYMHNDSDWVVQFVTDQNALCQQKAKDLMFVGQNDAVCRKQPV